MGKKSYQSEINKIFHKNLEPTTCGDDDIYVRNKGELDFSFTVSSQKTIILQPSSKHINIAVSINLN